jgi:hypothetical protein
MYELGAMIESLTRLTENSKRNREDYKDNYDDNRRKLET